VAGNDQGLSSAYTICDPTQYRIELHFSFSADTSWTGATKIFDFSEGYDIAQGTDGEAGLFVGDGSGTDALALVSYDPTFNPVGTTQFTFGQPHVVVVQRYGAGSATPDLITVTLDGSLEISQYDIDHNAVFLRPNRAFYIFTEENRPEGGYDYWQEEAPGTVTQILISSP